MQIRKGDVYYADLTPVVGSEQGGVRPVLIIQNNIGNRHSPTVIVAAITQKPLQTPPSNPCVSLSAVCGLRQDSMVLLEQVQTIDQSRLREYIGRLNPSQLQFVNQALAVSFGMEQEAFSQQMCIRL
ncbi:MAG: type II toxin-antitoxin system PemK/MazF family toxin [Enterocloster clostridioformis]